MFSVSFHYHTNIKVCFFIAYSIMYRAPIDESNKLVKKGNGPWKDKKGKSYANNKTEWIYLLTVYVTNSSCKNSGMILKLFNAAKKLIGLPACDFRSLNNDRKVQHWNRSIQNKHYEWWIEIRISYYEGKAQIEFVVDDVIELQDVEISDEEESDSIC